jgi:putative flavoprotein involved in K+ transport
VATGGYHHPRVPTFATELNSGIVQLHSTGYRNPTQLRPGDVLVVGSGNSGAEIALDLADRHRVVLSGPDTGQEPTRAGTVPDRLLTPFLWLAATRLTARTPMGRKLRDHFLDPPRGIPLGRVRRKDIVAAGIERVGRTVGARDGCPALEDRRVMAVSNVIWCTGFTPAFDWIDIPLRSHNGYPLHHRGIVESCPGLYFIGLLFLYSLSSALLGGVGRDAKYIVDHLDSTRSGARKTLSGQSVTT